MSFKLLNYSNWKKINEGLFWDVVEKEPIAGTNHKVKVKYIDGQTIKVKAVNDLDMVGEDGTVNNNLMDAVVRFLQGHDATNFKREYPDLQNLPEFYKNSFFTYEVKKENDRRQVVVFTIQKRANFKGIAPETKLISGEKAKGMATSSEATNTLAKADKILAAPIPKEPQTEQVLIKLPAPIEFKDINSIKVDSAIFNAIKSTYLGVLKNTEFINLINTYDKDFLQNVKTELKSGQLGENAQLFIKAIISAFDIKDEYGDPVEKITQAVVNKLSVDASQYPQDIQAKFAKTIESAKAEGQKSQDVKVSPEKLGEIQTLIISKFAKKLANSPLYKRFAAFGADKKFGPTTEKMVSALKAGLGCSETDGKKITQEFIDKLNTNKIDESYFDLNYRLVEQFDIDAYNKIAATYKPVAKKQSAKAETKKEEKPKTTSGKTLNLKDPKVIEEMEWYAQRVATTLIGQSYEDEKGLYAQFEALKNKAVAFIEYWNEILKLPYKTGYWDTTINTAAGWESYKSKNAVRTKTRECQFGYWIGQLLDDEEVNKLNNIISKYNNGATLITKNL